MQAFISNAKDDEIQKLYNGFGHGGNWQPLYYKDVSTLLLEIVGTTMASIPLTFGGVMEGLLKYRIDLNMLIRKPDVCPSRIIYEAERLNPNSGSSNAVLRGGHRTAERRQGQGRRAGRMPD